MLGVEARGVGQVRGGRHVLEGLDRGALRGEAARGGGRDRSEARERSVERAALRGTPGRGLRETPAACVGYKTAITRGRVSLSTIIRSYAAHLRRRGARFPRARDERL